ncbi:MAG: TrbI/VirB10 family protein [Acidobacteriia bacterium]|nr:TrbI/VirB10 family protein [Terriglobia bacterium]
MTTDPLHREDIRPNDGDSDATRRIHPGVEEPIETTKPEPPKGLMASLREAYERARDGRRQQPQEKHPRTAKSVDRSKGLLVLAGAVVIMIFGFLAMFSSSNATKEHTAGRNKPNLGRPDIPAATRQNQGSVTPLLAADTSSQDSNSDQVSPEDVKATGRMRLNAPPKAPKTLASVPPMDDPALEAYRQAKAGSTAPAPPAAVASSPAPAPQAAPVHNESDALKKSSLVFVRNNSAGSEATIRPASLSAEPALLQRKAAGVLPNGSRLVARLQAAVSTAVKSPVVAAIEYNYEKDGEIVIPAGTRAFGDLQQANRNGNIGIRFHTLQMPDGATEKIDATAMSLAYGPLKGSVSGGNAAKRLLVRSMTGVGTMAAYLVGGPGGFGGINGQLNNSVLLRERIASNAGLAGEQEMSSLAYNENIVITVPGNTRFFLVLLQDAGEKPDSRALPGGLRNTTQIAADGRPSLPSAQELRELIDLKAELNRMYGQTAATRTSGPAQQQ